MVSCYRNRYGCYRRDSLSWWSFLAAVILLESAYCWAPKIAARWERREWFAVRIASVGVGFLLLAICGIGIRVTVEKRAERRAAAAEQKKRENARIARQLEIERTAPQREAALKAWLKEWQQAEHALIQSGEWELAQSAPATFDKHEQLKPLCQIIPPECGRFQAQYIAPISTRVDR
ncbi:MAG: hypothetical protein IPJ88_04750 [Myxococcales bacterium]|nr:MAG: hypothetical protein IPJ88_04750 [Myxococcales bacterium]